MEGEAALVVCAGSFHGSPVLVADAVVDCFEFDGGEEALQWVKLGGRNGFVAREEDAVV